MLSNSPMVRIFFGTPISQDSAMQFQKRILNEYPYLRDQVRWTRPGNHHITVRFIGNAAKQKISTLITPVNEVVKAFVPFQIQLRHITTFPTTHGKFITVNIQPSPELQSLYDAIDLVVISSGAPTEHHPYMPHITLARFPKNHKIEFQKIPLGNETLQVNELVLYQSLSIEKGTLYVPLHKFSL